MFIFNHFATPASFQRPIEYRYRWYIRLGTQYHSKHHVQRVRERIIPALIQMRCGIKETTRLSKSLPHWRVAPYNHLVVDSSPPTFGIDVNFIARDAFENVAVVGRPTRALSNNVSTVLFGVSWAVNTIVDVLEKRTALPMGESGPGELPSVNLGRRRAIPVMSTARLSSTGRLVGFKSMNVIPYSIRMENLIPPQEETRRASE